MIGRRALEGDPDERVTLERNGPAERVTLERVTPDTLERDPVRGHTGTDHPPPTPVASQLATGQDWRTMTRHDFDTDTPDDGLFTLDPCHTPAPDDGYGTGDILELIGGGDH